MYVLSFLLYESVCLRACPRVRVCEATFCNALLKIFNAKLLWFWSSWSNKKELMETVGSVGPGRVGWSYGLSLGLKQNLNVGLAGEKRRQVHCKVCQNMLENIYS